MKKIKSSSLDRLLEWEIDPAFKRRAKIIGEQILEIVKFKKRAKVLEVGCGRGFYENLLKQICPEIKIVGVDNKETYLKQARQTVRKSGVSFVKADGRRLPFESNSFEAVICSEVLEHIEEDERVMAEMRRVVKNGGWAIISVPVKNYPAAWDPINWILERAMEKHIPAHIWWLAGIWADHVRLYGEDELTGKLDRSGWRIEKVYRCTRWCAPGAHFLLYGIGKNIVELGMLKEFNRFNFENQGSTLVKYAVKYFEWWDRKNERVELEKSDPFVNLVVLAQKS